MRIGLLSDTHISQAGEGLPPQVGKAFTGVDLILHAGDIYLLSVLDELEDIAPVVAARGNGDTGLPPDRRLKESVVLQIGGFYLGLTHSIIYPDTSWLTLEKAMERKFTGKVDVLVFGDTHVALVETYKGVLLVNPGSPTFPRNIKMLGTVGLLEIDGSKITPRLVSLDTIDII